VSVTQTICTRASTCTTASESVGVARESSMKPACFSIQSSVRMSPEKARCPPHQQQRFPSVRRRSHTAIRQATSQRMCDDLCSLFYICVVALVLHRPGISLLTYPAKYRYYENGMPMGFHTQYLKLAKGMQHYGTLQNLVALLDNMLRSMSSHEVWEM
jgi:hypothetical protein